VDSSSGRPDGDNAVAEQVRQVMGKLTSAERRVARALLSKYPMAGLETMPTLAERAGVSAPSVVRFIGKLGYDGYGDFQRTLRDEVQARLKSPLSQYERTLPAGNGHSLVEKAATIFQTSLSSTFAALLETELQAAVQALANQRHRVHTIGGRFSHVLARYLYAHLYHLRGNTTYVDPGVRPVGDAVMDVERRDVVVVFDYRRYQGDIIAFASAAARRQAEIVLFTDPWLSPASEFADIVLTARVEAPSPYDSLLGPLALVETLVAGLVTELGAPARERAEDLERLRRAVGTTEVVD
jgi:DNA-binding MurR/RpiR family transcriptional regulator